MAESIDVRAPSVEGGERVLTPEALEFVRRLHERFDGRRRELLGARDERQTRIESGETPGFLAETRQVRESEWRVAPAPADLDRRTVEITGPVDRKMMINALNSGANVFMADFEDSLSPTWENVVAGQVNCQDAVRRTLSLDAGGKQYRLKDELATLVIRPRGWHLDEKHVTIGGQPVSASLFDFGLYFFHNAQAAIDAGSGPYFYLPKMESHLEARLWNDVFVFAQDELDIPQGTIRATVLIETILAALEMDEILYELRDHAAGLNAGRWDYIFSVIKKFRTRPDMVLPDRGEVTMGVPFMSAYAQLLVKTCHRRGAHAMGGMAAFIPTRKDPELNEKALAKVREDKVRESRNGFDGTWVAHPDLVPIARQAFEEVLEGRPHQKHVLRDDVKADAHALLDTRIDGARITIAGVEQNVAVALLYIDSWLRGTGAAAIYNLMEDAATAEISRAQLWQWLRNRVKLADGREMTADLYRDARDRMLERVKGEVGTPDHRLDEAAELLDRLVLDDSFVTFLTLPGYEKLD
ncbi:MAG TPA: malate synthase A [Longimicrobiales bacterium]